LGSQFFRSTTRIATLVSTTYAKGVDITHKFATSGIALYAPATLPGTRSKKPSGNDLLSSFVSIIEPSIIASRQYALFGITGDDAPMVIPKTLPKLRTNTRKASACPDREGGSGARTGNTDAAYMRPMPIENGIGLVMKILECEQLEKGI